MKKILLLLVTGLFALACINKNQTNEPPKNSELIQQNYKGKVQRLEEVPYKVDSTGKIGEIDSCCIFVAELNEKGYTTRWYNKDKKGVISFLRNLNRFDNGQFKEWNDTINGKKYRSMVLQIDNDGKYSGAKSYDSAGKVDGYFTDFKENEYGEMTAFKHYKTDSSLIGTWTAEYDKSIWLGSTTTDSTGKVNGTYKNKLDDKGNSIEFTSTIVTKDSTTKKVETYKYNSYDDQGNWTQRTEYENGKPIKVAKRNFKYYK
jgi:hypothetical protein